MRDSTAPDAEAGSPAFYPAFLDLRGRRCLLAGAGGVGRRKLGALLACNPAEVLILDPAPPHADLTRLLAHPAARFLQRGACEADLEGMFLAVLATPDTALNRLLAECCQALGILCNVVDDPGAGSFIVPAHFRVDDLTVAVSTAGLSPALARRIRQDLQEYLGSRYEILLAVLGRLRPLILAQGAATAENTVLFRALADDAALAETLARRDRAGALDILRRLLPPPLHQNLDEVLHGLV